jgi:hypothetical protein
LLLFIRSFFVRCEQSTFQAENVRYRLISRPADERPAEFLCIRRGQFPRICPEDQPGMFTGCRSFLADFSKWPPNP